VPDFNAEMCIRSWLLPVIHGYGAIVFHLEHVAKTFSSGLRYGSKPVLKDINIRLNEGETYGLIGPSGCGKSTLARIMMGLISPSEGHVWFKGQDVAAMSSRQLIQYRRSVQIVFQNPLLSLDPLQSVLRAVAEPIWAHRISKTHDGALRKARWLLDECGIDASLYHRRPYQISGGQAQRVILARSLGLNPELIICDEPTAMLDVSVQAQILGLLNHLQETREITLFFISHDKDVIRAFCDRVGILQDGCISVEGKPKEILPQTTGLRNNWIQKNIL
jgi:peptide/nickel transport system ATP-binding protein